MLNIICTAPYRIYSDLRHQGVVAMVTVTMTTMSITMWLMLLPLARDSESVAVWLCTKAYKNLLDFLYFFIIIMYCVMVFIGIFDGLRGRCLWSGDVASEMNIVSDLVGEV